MMKTIHLHDSLAKFGESYDLDVRDPAEAIRALGSQLPGFFDTVRDGDWHVFRGPIEPGNYIDEEGLQLALGKTDEIHIMAAVQGAGGGVFQTIAGVALIVAGAFVPVIGESLMYAGGALALGGVTQMLTKSPSANYSSRTAPDQRPSFLFDGPTNTSTQGLPVPLIYGRMRVGSVVVSAGLTAEQIKAG